MSHSRDQTDDPALEVKPTSGQRLLGIEGLRAAAALSVMLGHFNLHLVPDELVSPVLQKVLNVAGQGLTLFFVLSGFLLFGPFLSAANRGVPFNISQYFLNRFLRIYPAYVVIFTITALALGLAYTKAVSAGDAGVEGTAGTIGRMTDLGAIAANLALVHTLLPGTIKTGLGVSWSLTAEICFYLVLPLLAAIAVRQSRRLGLNSSAVIVSLGMVAVGLACRTIGNAQVHGDAATQFYLQWGGNWLAVFLRSILCQADLFGFGMLALVAFRYSAMIVDANARTWFRRSLYGAALLGLALSRLEHEFGFAVFFGSLLLIVTTPTATSRANWLLSILEWPPIRWLGVISYSFYLWHLPVIWGAYKWQLHEQRPDTLLAIVMTYSLVLAITTALSTMTYLLVERPALLLKSKPNKVRPVPAIPLRRDIVRSADGTNPDRSAGFSNAAAERK
jgi:peptidoglycan/LPS O-acetylase OafA/YrhL